MTTYLCIYLGSLVLSLLTTPVVIWLARRIGAVERPARWPSCVNNGDFSTYGMVEIPEIVDIVPFG